MIIKKSPTYVGDFGFYSQSNYQRTYSTVFPISPCVDVLYTPFMDFFLFTVENREHPANMYE